MCWYEDWFDIGSICIVFFDFLMFFFKKVWKVEMRRYLKEYEDIF